MLARPLVARSTCRSRRCEAGLRVVDVVGEHRLPRVPVKREGGSQSLSLVGNVVWFVLSGLWLAIGHAFAGVLLCITVIGIPLGVAYFKLILLALTPVGKDIVKKGWTVQRAMITFEMGCRGW